MPATKARKVRLYKDSKGYYILVTDKGGKRKKLRVESDITDKPIREQKKALDFLLKTVISQDNRLKRQKRRTKQNANAKKVGKKVYPILENTAFSLLNEVKKKNEDDNKLNFLTKSLIDEKLKLLEDKLTAKQLTAPTALIGAPPAPLLLEPGEEKVKIRTIESLPGTGDVLLVDSKGKKRVVSEKDVENITKQAATSKTYQKKTEELEKKMKLQTNEAQFENAVNDILKKKIFEALGDEGRKINKSGRTSAKSKADLVKELRNKPQFEKFLLTDFDTQNPIKSINEKFIPTLLTKSVSATPSHTFNKSVKRAATPPPTKSTYKTPPAIPKPLAVKRSAPPPPPIPPKAEEITPPVINDLDEDEVPPEEMIDDLNELDVTTGEGKNNSPSGKGLYDYEIEKIMEPYNDLGFMGVISADEIPKIIEKVQKRIKSKNAKKEDRISFVMNLDTSDGPGYHWVACYIDPSFDRSIEFYNSFGYKGSNHGEPTPEMMEEIKKLIDTVEPETYLKFKVNKVKQQSVDTANCGYFCMKFLIDRYNGKSWQDATGFRNLDLSKKSEEDIKKFKRKIKRFGEL